jgi:hypothetical protein
VRTIASLGISCDVDRPYVAHPCRFSLKARASLVSQKAAPAKAAPAKAAKKGSWLDNLPGRKVDGVRKTY